MSDKRSSSANDVTCILHRDIEQKQVSQFDRVHGHDSAFSQVAHPSLIRILIINSIIQIIRKKIFYFKRCTKPEIDFRISVIIQLELNVPGARGRTAVPHLGRLFVQRLECGTAPLWSQHGDMSM
jgi:hypothetical protein